MQLAHGEVQASRREHSPEGQGPTLLLGLAAANRKSRRPVARGEAVALACRPMTPAAAFDAQNLEALLEGLAGFTAEGPGVTRFTYDDRWCDAQQWLVSEA